MAHVASSPPPAIVLGAIGGALSITRSLGREGIPVYVLGDGPASLAGPSRYCTELVDTGSEEGATERWLEWLRDAPGGSVVLPCGDHGLELVAGHSDELRGWGLRPLQTAGEASRAMLDKEKTYAIAAECGVAAPRTWRVVDEGDLAAIADELEYPCALKPLHSHRFAQHYGDRKLFVAERAEELRGALAQTRARGLEMLVTEIIPGTDERVRTFTTFVDDAGEPLFEAVKLKLRSYPAYFGVGTYHLTCEDAEAVEVGLRFLRGAGLRGLASIELKRDPRDESLKLIECNHRFTGSTELLCRAGVNVPLVAYEQALGRPVATGPCRAGVRLWIPGIDIKSAAEMRAQGDLTWPRWAASLIRYPLYMNVFSLGDLRPSAVNVARRARRRLRAAFGALGRR